ncbi:MAG: PCMD domain-containing protein [Paludibacteraceae bacterium]|nr:PCMD domain-containing protein [Paludibacteraceae bacterium]
MIVRRKITNKTKALCASILLGLNLANAQQIKYSDMDSWEKRLIEESFIIGNGTKEVYEIGKPGTVKGAKARERGDSPWETSSIYAHVSGIDKGSSTVFPEKRGNGYCARLESVLESVKVLGMINLSCLATGSIFTGYLDEPIKDGDKPMQYMMQGIPFTGKPKALKFDYKASIGGKRQKITVTKTTDLEGKNEAEVSVILQKRWEDETGKLHAKRIATGYIRIKESTSDWVNDYTLPLKYGNIEKEPDFKDYMGANYKGYPIWGKNSKGKKMKIDEAEYGTIDDTPTHIIIRFSCGYGGAFAGAIGDKFWVDNVELVY